MWCLYQVFFSVFVFIVVNVHESRWCLSQLAYDGARLSTFAEPDFRTSFIFRSNNGADSFKQVYIGRNDPAYRVRVYARVENGRNKGLCFEAVGSAQVSLRKKQSQYSYGGLIYAYNSSHVRIWAPSKFQNNVNGRLIFVGQGWAGERFSQQDETALVVVEVWYIGPLPTFQTSVVVDTRSESQVYYDIEHKLAEIPERVVVRVTPLDSDSPNHGFWFHALTSSQNVEKKGYGGVIFAYNAKHIIIWAPSGKRTGCIFVQKGWGGEEYGEVAQRCRVEVFAWVVNLPIPSFVSSWKLMNSQNGNHPSFLEITHKLGVLPSLVLVQGRISNDGLIFEGTGAVMSTDANSKGYGGIIYAFDTNIVRIWLPKQHKGHRNGYSIFIRDDWGFGQHSLQSHNVQIRVVLYTSNCDSTTEVVGERGACKSLRHKSYTWKTSDWWKCSSICNSGKNYRRVTGCEVSNSRVISSCSFTDDNLCDWQATPISSWQRLTEQQPYNHTWNYPRDSYYMSGSIENTGILRLASPRFTPRDSCFLLFKYKMVGYPSPIISVELSTDGKSKVDSGWSMRDNQGGTFWRHGYVNLASFKKLTQVFFKFTLHERSEVDTLPSYGNISLDDVKLECEANHKKNEDAALCRKHQNPSTGCVHPATMTTTRGPAFIIHGSGEAKSFVVAKGKRKDLIATYDFTVEATGLYSLWLYAWATSKKDNGVQFRIDNGDHCDWHTTYITKGKRPVWTQYIHQIFHLKAGLHTVEISQLEESFKYGYISLTPKHLSTWVPLGMQSLHIPDSYLKAMPPSSVPDPKMGRLNGEDAWCSSDHNEGYVHLQITLPKIALISRIAVQGGQDIQRRTNNYWVTRFSMRVSIDGVHSSWYRSVDTGRKKFRGNSDGGSIVEHELPYAVLAKHVQIFPYEWENWICMRVELYGLYTGDGTCAVAGPEPPSSKDCHGDRNCSTNADCRPITKKSIIKTGLENNVIGREACHCHDGYHGDSCQYIGCEPNPCENDGVCLLLTNNFTCHCLPGYHGPLCQHTCPVGWYGVGCAQECTCSKHGSCNTVTGYCSCQPGYFGKICDQRCPKGYYGVACKQRCRCVHGSCDHVNGSCTCKPGWTETFCDQSCGDNFWGVDCNTACKCSKNALSCDPRTGKCACRPGTTGEACDEACPPGKFGLKCTKTCRCGVHGICDAVNGSCACQSPGWTGLHCDQPCPRGFYGDNCVKKCDCSENSECLPWTGDCKCHSGYQGVRCDQPCPGGKWGPGCSHVCQCGHDQPCDSISGKCECQPGWHGVTCDNNCTDGSWGSSCQHNCTCLNNGSCDVMNGTCTCTAGWTGIHCEQPCPDGFYGPQCLKQCNCTNGDGCDVITGICLCAAGWYGHTCSESCPRGYYGDGCVNLCTCNNESTCDHVSGTCTCGVGWQGLDCDQRCSPGMFGMGCTQKCSCHMNNVVSCDLLTGYCHCKPGYTGASCEHTCHAGYYGDGCRQQCHCKNGAECRPTDGACICLAGYHGDRCDHECQETFYGINCTNKCSSCTNHQLSACDRVTGKCVCSPGYYGYRCENHCPEARYGLDCALRCDCKHDAHCNHVNGSCECTAGYTGTKCDQPCPNGTFGNECKGVCLCENGGTCDKVTGDCYCPAGFNGTQCHYPCPEGRFGLGCHQKCACTWNHTQKCRGDTGICECRAGYRGDTCEKLCISGTYGKSCKHTCPICSRHVTGSCYQVDGRCPCSDGYRGHQCDNDCPFKHYGKNCLKRCRCQDDQICYHVNGSCYLTAPGRFRIILKENYSEIDDTQRQKQLKLNIASLVASRYKQYVEILTRVARQDLSSHKTTDLPNTTTVSTHTTPIMTPTWLNPALSNNHDIVARILSVTKALTSDGQDEVTAITMVLFDTSELLNGDVVMQLLDSMDEEELSEQLGSAYYSGDLFEENVNTQAVYVQLITGLAGGLLILVILVIVFLMCKRRRRQLKKLKAQKEKEKEAETEMEMKTRSFRHNGYRLAFDNPYYDVLAAMALDDDIEDDYINPLCDLESLMSHQGSDRTVSSATECSIPKGESLQSVSYC